MRLIFLGATPPQKTPYTTGALLHEMELLGVKIELEISTSLNVRVAFTDTWSNG